MKIEINNLNKVYRGNVHALRDLNLTIGGGMFGLLGPNGAGKTTLMRILAGILHSTNGSLQIGPYDGTTEKGRTGLKQVLGYLPQDLGVYPDLSAREFLDYVAILKGLDDRTFRRRRVEELLETVALSDVANRKLKTYSGGMKRRAGIAQALLNDPQFLIVDEPTAGLDPEERIRFRNLLSDLAGERTVLLSTHIVEDIAQTCQNIAVMKSGQVIFSGTIAQMLEETREKTWIVTTSGSKPQGEFSVISTLNMGHSIQYRIVGDAHEVHRLSPTIPSANIVATEPGLEDGYVWFMSTHRNNSYATSSTL
ncbi:ABC transporter ATP-binding protein [Tengunoibacter tsumagoiensis]|uniref:Multidrug ABC transporter ATP-binding protein n=1 Tax=Tengunoibacter tsumagoiensis TaxID=2014871 RepID=A0A401ZWV0_9CHLR|nr:ABC transporter ATP-binding protein [Tengunoibacter tsumagoiensis]GCE11343.1 multidrug ABC transporter ATP-binding protein [Tengunoibacter tsumagoiensis]